MIYSTNGASAASGQASSQNGRKSCTVSRSLIHTSVKKVQNAITLAVLLLLAACSSSNNNDSNDALASHDHAVGITSMTFIDTSRPTAAHGPVPETPTRTIETTLVYPTEGTPGGTPAPDAPAELWGAPYPLVILSHGLGGNVAYLLPLAEKWASRGYVVALPKFPLTNSATPGGPAAQDVQNQPADVSFVIDEVLAQSNTSGRLLSNAVDAEKIAASGHSNGAITTYGLVANSCCRDTRIDAAVILSGVLSPFSGGEYDLSNTPPTFIVHGVNDILIAYNQSILSYNELQPPKGLLTLEDSNHGAYLLPEDPMFDAVAQATVDFLDGELRDDSTALERLPGHEIPGLATLHWAPDEASNIPVDTIPEPETNRQASISADNSLVDGQVITVSWSGFLREKVVNIMQCTDDPAGAAAACNISGGILFYPSPEGMGSVDFVIRTGPIGNGVCDSAHPCTVLVNDAGLTDEAAILRIPITFAD